jgi:hypothetical protein
MHACAIVMQGTGAGHFVANIVNPSGGGYVCNDAHVKTVKKLECPSGATPYLAVYTRRKEQVRVRMGAMHNSARACYTILVSLTGLLAGWLTDWPHWTFKKHHGMQRLWVMVQH